MGSACSAQRGVSKNPVVARSCGGIAKGAKIPGNYSPVGSFAVRRDLRVGRFPTDEKGVPCVARKGLWDCFVCKDSKGSITALTVASRGRDPLKVRAGVDFWVTGEGHEGQLEIAPDHPAYEYAVNSEVVITSASALVRFEANKKAHVTYYTEPAKPRAETTAIHVDFVPA